MRKYPTSPHIIFSVENPAFPKKVRRKVSHEDAQTALSRAGNGIVVPVKGHYGGEENSIMVVNPSDRQLELARKLAHMTGQESHIESDGMSHKMYYNHGPKAGKVVFGRGVEFPQRRPDDMYSELPDGTLFKLKFDDEEKGAAHPASRPWHETYVGDDQEPEDMGKAETHPHLQAHGPDLNEQAGGNQSGHFHEVMGHYGTITPGKKTNLKFYHGIDEFQPKIDQHLKETGYTPYLAGGKHGKPDLANKNYTTKHLMIYDPSEGSGGDYGNEQFTSAWRKIHEKAHADTLPEVNKLYGEGRRLGKLGVRTPREMARSLVWEHLAAHKQRDLMEQLGHKMSEEDFAREYNTVMGDALIRSITGKFSDPHEMGFYPHSKKVPLEHTLGILDQHAKKLGLRHQDDSFARQKAEGLGKSENMKKADPNPRPKKMKVAIKDLHQDEPGVANAHKTFHFEPNFKVSDKPVDVGMHVKTGKLHLLNGYHRVLAAQKRGDTHVEAHVIPTKGSYGHPKVKGYEHTFFHKPASWSEIKKIKKSETSAPLAKNEFLASEEANPLLNRVETKYFIPYHKLSELTNLLKERLSSGDCDTSVRFNRNRTIYLDNPDMDAFRDNMESVVPRFKVRVRQYSPNKEGWEDVAYVELKIKAEDGMTRKVRLRVPDSMVESVCEGKEIPFDEDMVELNREIPRDNVRKRVAMINSVIHKYGFRKHLEVQYDRRAYSNNEIRVTVDDRLEYKDAQPVKLDALNFIIESDNWKKMVKTATKLSRDNMVIVEFKHEKNPPEWLEEIADKCDLKKVKFSKYCAAVVTHILTGNSEGIVSRAQKIEPEVIKEMIRESALQKNEGKFEILKKDESLKEQKEILNHPNTSSSVLRGLADNPNVHPEIKKLVKQKLGIKSVSFSLNTNKLRELRDHLDEQHSGVAHKNTLKQHGYDTQALGINHLLDSKGNLSSKSVQQHIDSQPKLNYEVGSTTYGKDHGYKSPEEARRENEKAEEKHRENFDPVEYGLYQNDYLDKEGLWEHAKAAERKKDKPYGIDPVEFSSPEEFDDNVDLAEKDTEDDFDHVGYAIDNGLDDFDSKYFDSDSYERAEQDALEDHMSRFEPPHSEEANEEAFDDAVGSQQHIPEPSKVFQLRYTPEHEKQMKEAGVFDTFKDMLDQSKNSGHPVDKKTLGWVRHTKGPDGTHIDEIQSDFGQSFVKQAAAQAKAALNNGEITQEQAETAVSNANKRWPEDHFKKISDILFDGKDPNHVIHEAFLQHSRNEGDVGKQVHVWNAVPKGDISLRESPRTSVETKSLMETLIDPEKFKEQERIVKENDKEHMLYRPSMAKKRVMDKLGVKTAEDMAKLIADKANKEYSGKGISPEDVINHVTSPEKVSEDKRFPINAAMSGMNQLKVPVPELIPGHMRRTYEQQPPKLGYKPSKYGNLQTQYNPNLEGEDTWEMKLRKREDLGFVKENCLNKNQTFYCSKRKRYFEILDDTKFEDPWDQAKHEREHEDLESYPDDGVEPGDELEKADEDLVDIDPISSEAKFGNVKRAASLSGKIKRGARLTATSLYRHYKHTPHHPVSLGLKYMIHRMENAGQYDAADQSTKDKMDADFLAFHKQGKAAEKNGHIKMSDLREFYDKNQHLPGQLLAHKKKLHDLIRRVSPNKIKVIDGKEHVALTRGLNTVNPGLEHALASYGDIPNTGFGMYMHHRWVPLKNLWYSYDAGRSAGTSEKFGNENEFLVSPHEIKPIEEEDQVSKLLPRKLHTYELEKDLLSHIKVRGFLAEESKNPDLHREILNHPETDSFVLGNLALNPNVHPDAQREILNHPKTSRFVLENLADNPNVHPDVKGLIQQKFGQGEPLAASENYAKNLLKKEICMPKEQAVREHRRLVSTLKHPTKEKLKEEAKEQSSELKEYIKKSKNVREQRAKVFGKNPQPSRLSDKRIKMMQRIRDYAGKQYGMDLQTAQGKRDEQGRLREKPDLAHEPYDVFSRQGVAAEKERLAQVKERGETRTDPKPHWHSDVLETQPSPDAAVHELAHLNLAPEETTAQEFQEQMDAAYGRHGQDYGHAQGKRTSWEVQPMSVENQIRRMLGLPANKAKKTQMSAKKLKDFNTKRRAKGLPALEIDPEKNVELTWDTREPRFHRAKDIKGQEALYDRSSHLQNPETRERMTQIKEGSLKFDPKKGWQKVSDVNALINLRGRGHSKEARRRLISKMPKKLAASEIIKSLVPKKRFSTKYAKQPHKNMTLAQLQRLQGDNWHNPDTGTEISAEDGDRRVMELRSKKADEQVDKWTKQFNKGELEKGAGGDWEKEGYTFKIQDVRNPMTQSDITTVIATHPSGKVAGKYHFTKDSPGTIYPVFAQTNKGHERKGLASEAYRLAQKHTGMKVVPSTSQSQDAKKLWAQRDRSFGKSKKLEHYSTEEGLKQIDPKFKGRGVDAGVKGRDTEHPHSFFYIAGTEPEHIVSNRARSRYVIDLPDHAKLYDLGTDPEKHIEAAVAENNGALNMDMVHARLKKAGYHGFYNSAHPYGLTNVVALYHAQPVSEEHRMGKNALGGLALFVTNATPSR